MGFNSAFIVFDARLTEGVGTVSVSPMASIAGYPPRLHRGTANCTTICEFSEEVSDL